MDFISDGVFPPIPSRDPGCRLPNARVLP